MLFPTRDRVNQIEASASPKRKLSSLEQLKEFSAGLQQLCDEFSELSEMNPCSDQCSYPGAELLAKSLLLSGAGKGYEPAYAYAIRCYTHAWEEVHRLESDEVQIDSSTRSHFLASWNRELRDRLETLKILGIEIIDVRPGDDVDTEIHAPLKMKVTPDHSKFDTVAEVICPGFRYRDDEHRESIEAAKVVVFNSGGSMGKSELGSRRPSSFCH